MYSRLCWIVPPHTVGVSLSFCLKKETSLRVEKQGIAAKKLEWNSALIRYLSQVF